MLANVRASNHSVSSTSLLLGYLIRRGAGSSLETDFKPATAATGTQVALGYRTAPVSDSVDPVRPSTAAGHQHVLTTKSEMLQLLTRGLSIHPIPHPCEAAHSNGE